MSDEKKPLFSGDGMKPIIILPPDAMSFEQIKLLRANGLCVVIAKDPAKVTFLDPIPAVIGRTAVDTAAIALSRKVLSPGCWQHESTRQRIAEMYVDLLVKGTSLDPDGTREEQERVIFDAAKRDELARLGREEARAERAAKKAEKK